MQIMPKKPQNPQLEQVTVRPQRQEPLFQEVTLHMSHFAYACKMRYPLNLVLENSEYL